MGSPNTYLQNHVPTLYRKSILDVMIFTFIDAQRFTVPTISITESAKAFMLRYQIDEGEMSLEKVVKTFTRLQKELFDEQKTNKG